MTGTKATFIGTVRCTFERPHTFDLSEVAYSLTTGRDEDGTSYTARIYTNGWVVAFDDDGTPEAYCRDAAKILRLASPSGVYLTDATAFQGSSDSEMSQDDALNLLADVAAEIELADDMPPPTNARLRQLAKTIDRASKRL